MIIIKDEKEISTIRQSGQILAQVLQILLQTAKEGLGTKEINKIAEEEFKKRNAWPAFKGYHGFPTSICTCLNEEIVHGPATPNRILKNGDILSIDLGCRYPAKKGMITDMATTLAIGNIPSPTQKLMDVTQKSLQIAIQTAKPGATTGDIGYAVQSYVEKNGFNVVRELVGHGVGKKLHESPQIPNYGTPGSGPKLKPGMTIAIEPMVSMGTHEISENKNGTFITADHSLSAHYEHSILITNSGAEILTQLN